MKSIYKNIIAFCFIMGFMSCGEEFVEILPQDRFVAGDFYKTESDIRSATAVLYGNPWFEFNDKFFWTAGDLMPGNVHHTWDQEGQFFYMSFSDLNGPISGGWNGLYRVVSFANSVINDMPFLAEGNVSQDIIDAGVAEGRFVRAYAYYILSEFWGAVPIIENSTDLIVANNLFLPRHTQASVYEFMKRDLEYAAANLPTSDTPGRVTSWAAKAMLAKLHLTMASHLNDGSSQANFEKAKSISADVINNSGLSLATDYASLFEISGNNNEESLFAMQWQSGAYGSGNSRQANFARSSRITGNTEAWGGGKCMTIDFINSVEPGDLRQPAIYMSNGDFYPSINRSTGGYLYEIVSYDPNDPATQLEGATPTLTNMKKYVIGSSEDTDGAVSTGQAAGVNTYLLRLADVYLIHAEASIGSGSSTSEASALSAFNAVRTRAGLSSLSSISFIDVLKERRVEFALEAMFWFDVKRYFYRDPNATLDYLNNQVRDARYQLVDNGDNQNPDDYEVVLPDNPVVTTAAKMYMPVPAGEIVVNPLLADEPVAYEF